jgi:HSP20 family molecular chaperone IbpA
LAPALQLRCFMPRPPDRNPKSYDDIVRETVLDPDLSKRPTREQERAAREGYWMLDDEERALRERILEAIAAAGAHPSDITVEVARDLVTLRGRVADQSMLRAIEDAVAGIAGVATVHNQVVVAPPHA